MSDRLRGAAAFLGAALALVAAVKLWKKPPPAPFQQPEPAPVVAASTQAAVAVSTQTLPEPEPAPEVVIGPPPFAQPMDPPKPAQDANKRRVFGVVYDLATLRVVRSARVSVLGQKGGINHVEFTDLDGRYVAEIPAGSDFNVWVDCETYKPGALAEGDPPYRLRNLTERRAVLDERAGDELEPVDLTFGRDELVLRQDLVLLPKPRTAADKR